MSLSQFSAVGTKDNWVAKIQSIAFTNEKNLYFFLPSYLSVPLSFPANWMQPTGVSQETYASLHPLNKACLLLEFTPASLQNTTSFNLEFIIPNYRIGTITLGTGSTQSTLFPIRSQYLNFKSQILFDGEVFDLDFKQGFLAIHSVALDFYTPMSGTLSFVNQLYYPPFS